MRICCDLHRRERKITVSDDEYTQYVENNLDTYGMSSVEEFESTYSKESVMDDFSGKRFRNSC